MKKLMFVALVAVLSLPLWSAGVHAQNRNLDEDVIMGLGMGPCGPGTGPRHGMGMGFHGSPGGPWMNELRELDLSKEQIDKVQEIHRNAMKQNATLHGQKEKLEIELRELMDVEKPDKDKAAAKIKEIEAIHTQMRVNHTNARIDMLGVLTKDQRDKLEEELFEARPFGKKKFRRFMED